MGIFDSYFDPSTYNGGMGNGLLSYLSEALKQKAGVLPDQGPQPTSVIGGAGSMPVPTFGQPTGMDLSAQSVQPQAQQAQASIQPQAAPQLPQPQPDFGSGFFTGAPQGSLRSFIGGLTGASPNPTQATYRALIQSGVPDGVAQAAALNPEVLKTIAPQLYNKPKAMLVPGLGGSQIQFVDEANQTINGKPVTQAGGAGQGGNLDEIASNVAKLRSSGAPQESLLQQIPPAMREAVGAMLEGRAIPQNFSFRGDARNGAILLAHAIDPNFDEGQLAARQQFAKDLGNTKSGLGFRIESGKKMLNHMESLAGNLGKLDNADIPSGIAGYVVPAGAVNAVNAVRNNPPGQQAIAKDAQNIAQSFSQEKGKFLGGPAGGSMHEREKTVDAYNPQNPRSQLAGALQGDLDLFKGQFGAMNSQRDNLLGPGSTSTRFQVTTPEMEAQMQRIQEKIDAIRGGKSTPETAATPSAPTAVNAKGQRITLDPKTNQWVPVR